MAASFQPIAGLEAAIATLKGLPDKLRKRALRNALAAAIKNHVTSNGMKAKDAAEAAGTQNTFGIFTIPLERA